MSLLESPTGHLTNLSAVPALSWRGLAVAPPSRCKGHRYDREEYGTRYRSKEDDIILELGGIYGPYTVRCFESDWESTIEHIVAINEAHYSGRWTEDTETKRTFAGDLLNLTLASNEANRTKSNLDAFDWSHHWAGVASVGLSRTLTPSLRLRGMTALYRTCISQFQVRRCPTLFA